MKGDTKTDKLFAKVRALKEALKELHSGKDVEQVKAKIKDILMSVSPWEIPFVEQELVKEGISPFEIVNMCDIHVELFRERLMQGTPLRELPEGHPLHTLLKENEEIIKDSEKLSLYARGAITTTSKERRAQYLNALIRLAEEMLGIRRHFMKIQMLLFPYLERRGLTAVPRVLWTKQDQVIHKIKLLLQALRYGDVEKIGKEALELTNSLTDMVFRENTILFPTAHTLLTEGEWAAIKEEERVIGYYKYVPSKNVWKPKEPPKYPYEVVSGINEEQIEKLPNEIKALLSRSSKDIDDYTPVGKDRVKLNEGYLSVKELDAILRTLPIDISFVDSEDRLRYYSGGKERIFVRTRTVIGRKVDLCHPPRSVNIVKKILEEFKAGRRDSAEFWIRMGDRLIHIRYFPVRDEDGKYLGTLEVVQDITDLEKISGEKRILDWE